MKKFLSFILCMIMVVSALTLTGCKDKNAVGQEWQVKTYTTADIEESLEATQDDKKNVREQKVGFKVSRNSGKIKDVWFNVKEIKGENVSVTFSKYKTSEVNGVSSDLVADSYVLNDGPIVITASQVKEANKNAKGWIKLNTEAWNLSYDTVLMTLTGNITLREIVFVGSKDEVLTAEISKANVGIEYTVGKKDKRYNEKEFTKAELEAYAETAIYGIPNFLLDNQEAFATRNDK